MDKQREILSMIGIFSKPEIEFLACFACEQTIQDRDICFCFHIPEGVPVNLGERMTAFNKQQKGIILKLAVDHSQLKHAYLYDYLNQFLKDHNNALLKATLTRHAFKIQDQDLYLVYWNNEEKDAWGSYETQLINTLNDVYGLHLNRIVYVEDVDHQQSMQQRLAAEQEATQQAIEYYEQAKKHPTKTYSPTNSFKQTYRSNKRLNEPAVLIGDLNLQDIEAIVQGQIFKKEITTFKNETILYRFIITDFSGSLIIKGIKRGGCPEYENLKEGDWIKVRVKLNQDRFEHNNVVGTIQEFSPCDPLFKDYDDSPRTRVELCVHTKMSAYDGLIDVQPLLDYLSKSGIKSVGITDKNNVQIYPDLSRALSKSDIKPLYGYQVELIPDLIEAVLNPTNENILSASYVIFDLETTGLYANTDEIIEFGAVKYENGQVVDTMDLFVKTKEPIGANITNLTNITNQMVQQKGLEPEEAFPKIIDFIGNSVMVAHNGISFDFNFLNVKLIENGFQPLTNVMVDSMVISRSINTDFNNNTLGHICRKYHIEYDDSVAHRANYDADVLYKAYKVMMGKLADMGIYTFDQINDALQNPSLRSKTRGDDILLYVKNQAGIRDLYELISIASTTNFYKRPTLTWNIINQHRDNLYVANAPVDGEVFNMCLTSNDLECATAWKPYDFLTIAPVQSFLHLIDDQRLSYQDYHFAIKKILKIASQLDKKVCASSDPYYLFPYEKNYHDVYVFTPGLNGRKHRFYKFNSHPDQHIFSGQEMEKAFDFLVDQDLINQLVYDNPDQIADSIASQIKPLQDKLFAPEIPGVNEKVRDYVYQTAHATYGDQLPQIVVDRIEKELNAIIGNGYAVVYWISHLLVKESLSDGYVVGSRGSVGSSLVATFLNITDVNPLTAHYLCKQCHYTEFTNQEDGFDLPDKKCPQCGHDLYGEGHSIPFETFLGFKGDKVPDIDLNFSGVYQPQAHNFIKKMFGATHAFRAGTIATVAEKTSYGFVKNFFETQESDLLLNEAEVERYAANCLNVKRTTGQHPGGIVVVPQDKSIYDFTPYNYPADDPSQDWFTTHFAFEAIHDNLLKFDILGHDNPTALKMLKDLTKVDEKDIPNQDDQVMALFRSCEPLKIEPKDILNETTGALSLPEFGTPFVRKMLEDTQPQRFSDLVRISGLSHGTDVWINNAQALIKDGHTLENVIGCRDDIMVYLLSQHVPDSKAFSIMEDVRKGKQIKKEDEALLREYHIPEWWIDSANKIKYMFPKAHATAYVIHAWKFAYYKLYYPLEYYATWFTIRPDAYDLELMVLSHGQIKLKLEELIKLNNNGSMKSTLTTKQKDLIPVLEIVLEMKARKFEFFQVDINRSHATEFIIDYEHQGIIAPFVCIDSLGDAVAESVVAARNERPFTSQEDLSKRTKLTKQHFEVMEKLGILDNLPKNDQVSLFDDLFN